MSTPSRKRKSVIGQVTSTAMQKTIAVTSETFVQHPKYKKFVRRATVYKAHDEQGDAKLGDTVRIEETRPLSKTKRWRLADIITRGPGQ